MKKSSKIALGVGGALVAAGAATAGVVYLKNKNKNKDSVKENKKSDKKKEIK